MSTPNPTPARYRTALEAIQRARNSLDAVAGDPQAGYLDELVPALCVLELLEKAEGELRAQMAKWPAEAKAEGWVRTAWSWILWRLVR